METPLLLTSCCLTTWPCPPLPTSDSWPSCIRRIAACFFGNKAPGGALHRRLVICTQPAFVSFFLFFWLTKNEKKIPCNARGVHAAWLVVHAQCMPCVKTALVRALGSTSAAHMSVPSCPTRRCPPRAPQLRQHACYYQLVYVYMLCMCLRCHSSSLFIHQWHAARVAPRRRRRDIWCEPQCSAVQGQGRAIQAAP